MQKRYWIIGGVIAVFVLVGIGIFSLTFLPCCAAPRFELDPANPQEIVSKIGNEIYKSPQFYEYATIRWTYKTGYGFNNDIPAKGAHIEGPKDFVYPLFTKTNTILKQNNFVIDELNKGGKSGHLEDIWNNEDYTYRETVGYQNGKTVCEVDFFYNKMISKSYLTLNCGLFEGPLN